MFGGSVVTSIDRRQRWGTFSVRAHRDPGELAVDILLYDRIVLPVPGDQSEFDRWARAGWDPEGIAVRTVQAGGLIHTVPWTAELRDEWSNRWRQLKALGSEVAYGATAGVLSQSERAWQEIMVGLAQDEKPERKPFILAAYQSREEAFAEIAAGLDPGRGRSKQAGVAPGNRDVDEVAALAIHHILAEPVLADPEEAFVAAAELAVQPSFQRARRALFDLEDNLYTDEWEPDEVHRSSMIWSGNMMPWLAISAAQPGGVVLQLSCQRSQAGRQSPPVTRTATTSHRWSTLPTTSRGTIWHQDSTTSRREERSPAGGYQHRACPMPTR
jgi:hypothetical protein